MQEIKADSQQNSHTQSSSTFSFSRRSFIRAIMAAVALPENLNEALTSALVDQSEDKLPWITNPEVRAALEELEVFNKITTKHFDFLIPNQLGRYVMGSFSEEPTTVNGNSLFGSEFWSLLKERNCSAIGEAVKIANSVAEAECNIEPRRRELVDRIKELTGEEPWMLKIKPELREAIKRVCTDRKLELIGTENMWEKSNSAFTMLRDYYEHYRKGSLNLFFRKYANQWQWQPPQDITSLCGNDYVSSTEEIATYENGLEHLLGMRPTRIDSSKGQCCAYYFKISSDRAIARHLHNTMSNLSAKYKATNTSFQLSDLFTAIEGHTTAYDIGPYQAAFFLYDPPAALAELLENKKAAKDSRSS